LIYNYYVECDAPVNVQTLDVEIYPDGDGNNDPIETISVNVHAPVGWLGDFRNAAKVSEWAQQAYFE
jgi:hypothetical protein